MKQKLKTMALAWALTPCLAFATTWYVDGTNGSDDNVGTSQGKAKATIQAAIDVSASNDTIIVSDGIYSSIVATNHVLTIRSVSGARKTIIDGQHTERCALFSMAKSGFYPKEIGDPAYASTLAGFTLRNGVVPLHREDAEINIGAGVRGGTINDCVIEFCRAYMGAGAAVANLNRCIVRNNVVEDDGGGLFCCCCYDSLICNNQAKNDFGYRAGAAASTSRLYNCTVTGNVSAEAGTAAIDYYMEVHNCLVWGNKNAEGNEANIIDTIVDTCYTEDPHFVDAAIGDYRLAADSPCIDAGDNSYVVGEHDLDCSERIVNGRVDIGCYEYGSVGGPYVEKVGETNWTYMIKNGKASVGDGVGAAVTNTIAGAVDVPSVLRGRPVTAIDHSAFLNCGEMTSVTIPTSVTEIGNEAFSGCEKLADVWFEGNTIEKIGRHAFLGCYWDLIMHVPADWQGRGRTIAGYTVWRGGSSDVEKCVNMTVTNVVVQYVFNSIRPEIAVPVSNSVGLVNIITEVASSGAVSVPTEWKDNYSHTTSSRCRLK